MSQIPPSHRPFYISDLLTIFLLCLLIYLTPSFMRPIANPDEARYAEVAREMQVNEDYLNPKLNDVSYFDEAPLFLWAQASSIDTFGISRTSLRFPNVMFAIFGILITYHAARRVYGRRAGLISSAVLATSAFFYAFGNIATPDMALTVFTSAALFSFLAAYKEKESFVRRGLSFILFFIFSALALMSNGLEGIILPLSVILLFLCFTGPISFLKSLSKSDLFACILGFLAFCALALPWYILTNAPFLSESISNKQSEPWLFFALMPLGFLPWLVFLPRAIWNAAKEGWKKFKTENAESLFFIIWTIFVFSFFAFSKSKLVAYILPIYPAIAILVGSLIAKSWKMADNAKELYAERSIISFLGLIATASVMPIYFTLRVNSSFLYPESGLWLFALLAVIFLLGTGLIRIFLAKGFFKYSIVSTVLTMCFALFLFCPIAKHIQRASTEGFAKIIKTQRQNSERIILVNCTDEAQDLNLWMNEIASVCENNTIVSTNEKLSKVVKNEKVFIVASQYWVNNIYPQSGLELTELSSLGKLHLFTNKEKSDGGK